MCRDINKSLTVDSHQKTDSKLSFEFSKTNNALGKYDETICEYAKLKLIQECLEELCNETTTLDDNISKKLREFITIFKIKRYLHLPNNSKISKDELTLLGIVDLPSHEFSFQKQLTIKSCLEAKIQEKIHQFLSM